MMIRMREMRMIGVDPVLLASLTLSVAKGVRKRRRRRRRR